MGSTLREKAVAGLNRLAHTSYPGRGIVAGLNDSGSHMVQVYWIMGRSENSRNRVFKCDDKGRLYTDAADPAKLKDPSLIIYDAMLENDPYFVVSNGAQTKSVLEGIQRTPHLQAALEGEVYEPDGPNFTPRITAVSSMIPGMYPSIQMSVLRKSLFGDGCDTSTYLYDDLAKGYGWCITTYMKDGNPLPPYVGDPFLVTLDGDIDKIAQDYWSLLNRDNRVSLAVKFIDMDSHVDSIIKIINKY